MTVAIAERSYLGLNRTRRVTSGDVEIPATVIDRRYNQRATHIGVLLPSQASIQRPPRGKFYEVKTRNNIKRLDVYIDIRHIDICCIDLRYNNPSPILRL